MRAWALASVLATIACSEDDGIVSVYAAASLRETVEAMAEDFESAHPGWTIQSVFAGSQTLRIQAQAGARFDVFVSAHPEHVAALHAAGRCDAPEVVAKNRLALLVPADSPVQGFEDLPEAERIVLGTPEVPVGRYADELLRRAEGRFGAAWATEVRSRIVSRERNVRLVRAKVAMGEAGAAIVYATDAQGEGLRAVPIDPAWSPVATYAAAAASPAGRRFSRWLAGPRGQAHFRQWGFAPP